MVSFKGVVEAKIIFSELVDILFHPYSAEGFGRIYIEAMERVFL